MKRLSARGWHIWAAAAIPFFIFIAVGTHLGIPMLRHDWDIPSTSTGWHAFIINQTSGWSTTGIGAPRPYPTLFLLAPLLAAVGLAFGSVSALSVFLAAIASAYLYSGIRIGERLIGQWYGLALGTGLLFSPWIYEKIVAGHLTMMLAVGLCGVIAGESISERPRTKVLLLCGYIAAFQIQFAFLAIVVAAAARWSRHTIGPTVIGASLSLLPSFVGIISSTRTLSAIPYTLAWQLNNSVSPGSALLLDGYSPHYTSGSGEPALDIATGLLASLALIGIIIGLRRKSTRGITIRTAVACMLLILYATGLRGPIGPLYLLSLRFKPFLLFRELFDLLGVAAIFYAILAAIALNALPRLRIVLPAIAATLCIAWLAAPPWHWWISSSSVPRLTVSAALPNHRFALIPWQQPMRFRGAGAGTDPDLYMRPHNVTPLNEYSPSYPADVALSEYVHDGRVRPLEALSVSEIYVRPYLATDDKTLNVAVPRTRIQSTDYRTPRHHLTAFPELSLTTTPKNSAVPLPFEQPYLFDNGSEARLLTDILPVTASDANSNARSSWIYAPLIYPQYPEVGNAIGGAFTISAHAALAVPVPVPHAALIFVHGALLGQGLTRSTKQGWQWIALNGSTQLYCRGECLVAAWQRRPVSATSHLPFANVSPLSVPFRAVLPYILTGNVPEHSPRRSLLLFRSRYNSAWALIGVPNKHLIVSMIFNGFQIPPTFTGPFLLIETTALLQAIAMFASICALIFTLAFLPNRSTFQNATTRGDS